MPREQEMCISSFLPLFPPKKVKFTASKQRWFSTILEKDLQRPPAVPPAAQDAAMSTKMVQLSLDTNKVATCSSRTCPQFE